eukprot:865872-Pleurochrysis_carterae.AAC.1
MEARLVRADWCRLLREARGAEAAWVVRPHRPANWAEAAERMLQAPEAVTRHAQVLGSRTAVRSKRQLPAGSAARLELADEASGTEHWRAVEAVVVD